MNKQLCLILSFILFTSSYYCQIYVAPGGSDSSPGTFAEPLATIPAAVIKAQPGDTIYLRGGTYTLSTTITISKDGSESSRFYLSAFNGQRPLLDFSSMAVSTSNRGIRLSGDYWHIKGINIKGAGDNGMNISGSNNIIEFCSFFENRDTGLQLGGGASNNQIINCDSYFNADPGNGNADGFAPKLDVGNGNYFYGCRSWQNSDDGWDGYMRDSNDVSTVLENCWCFA
ncbi:MAG TPA: right-handed parallel beta-helix repeat-containing protein, partial [Ignavibacteriaceae bacterium]|nr:right-handed parallel beta-helix repeat-containing protein [Ignavibacteriaceae bacterium]